METGRRLYRSRDDQMLGGVCAGLADYFGLDPTVVRMLAVLLAVVGSGMPVLAYIIMWVVVPDAPEPPRATGYPASAGGSSGVATVVAPPPPPPPTQPGYSPAGDGWRRRRGGGGVWFGVVLVIVGALLISGRFMEGFAWWAMWPLVIVIAGLIQAVTPGKEGWGIGRLFDGLTGVAFGLVLLGNTTGFLSWSVWWRIVTMWPVLLIAIGFSVLARGLEQQWMRAIGSLAVIGAIAWAAAVSVSGSPVMWYGTMAGDAFTVSEPADMGVKEGSLDLKGGVGEMSIEGGSSLFSAEGDTSFGTPDYRSEVTSTSAEIMFDLGHRGVAIAPNTRSNHAEIALARGVAWDLTIDIAVAQLRADLSDVDVTGLILNSGVSSADLKLGDVPMGSGDVLVTVKSGISSVDIRIPESAEVSVLAKTGLAAVDVDRGIERAEGAGQRLYKTAGFDNATRRYVIEVEMGIGSVNVDRY
ncbi:MAG: PspC domain-containing protein [Actinomycetota bacterium]|nr:PspC domain-containing protein [Actinomycetota bacterium]